MNFAQVNQKFSRFREISVTAARSLKNSWYSLELTAPKLNCELNVQLRKINTSWRLVGVQ